MLQSVATEHFLFALSGNVTTGWRTVCQFVHRAGDWRGGSPSQIAGCCPKSAAHCCTAPGQKIRDSKGQWSAHWMFSWHQPSPVTNKQWFNRFLDGSLEALITQRKYVNVFIGYATVKILRHYLYKLVFLHSLGQLCAWIVHLCWGNPNIRLDVIERNEVMLQAVKPFALKCALKCSLLISDQVGYYLSSRA